VTYERNCDCGGSDWKTTTSIISTFLNELVNSSDTALNGEGSNLTNCRGLSPYLLSTCRNWKDLLSTTFSTNGSIQHGYSRYYLFTLLLQIQTINT